MASRHQRRLWRYLESGRHRRLRSLLARHREALDLDQPGGHKGRPPLHYACARRDPVAAQILLGHGADPALLDRRGDTALHHAARQAARKGLSVYKALFAPLQSQCPRAMGIRNRAGETPRDLLGPVKEEQQPLEEEGDAEWDQDRAWRQKLLGECHDEYQETWRYEEDFCTSHPDPEPYEEWAARMAREYRRKHCPGAGPGPAHGATQPPRPSCQRPREEESRLYQERARTKKEELREAKRRRYGEGCARVFAPDATRPLGYKDIPWPSPRGTAAEMAAVAMQGTDPADVGTYRRQLRRQQALWHPDKFAQRCGGRLAEPDRARILAAVTALSQELNRLAEAAK
ncbi:NF-kappa-B inhibitor-like protein 1 [Emydura macquarii macquarii]|uniref:NF-kappa-B inhibitor-like protein 1 n=1 Tax=Emydura macquarii macquarii TaxID=1129001 RepID=UPI003529EC0D